jgi:hypothetical protein
MFAIPHFHMRHIARDILWLGQCETAASAVFGIVFELSAQNARAVFVPTHLNEHCRNMFASSVRLVASTHNNGVCDAVDTASGRDNSDETI